LGALFDRLFGVSVEGYLERLVLYRVTYLVLLCGYGYGYLFAERKFDLCLPSSAVMSPSSCAATTPPALTSSATTTATNTVLVFIFSRFTVRDRPTSIRTVVKINF